MYYLVIDTNIWLNLINKSGEEHNPLELLYHLVKERDVKIILPEIIKIEWERNRIDKKNALIKEWKSFFNRAKKVFKSDVLKDLQTPSHLESLAEEQLRIVEDIFQNYAILVPLTDDIRLQSIELAEKKKAPFKNKNSIGDAYILKSMFQYVKEYSIINCIFVTENIHDFSDGVKNLDEKRSIHKDLRDDFKDLSIEYKIYLDEVLHKRFKDLESYKRFSKLKIIDTPTPTLENLKLIDGVKDSFIDDIAHIDIILKSDEPTSHQVLFILNSIKSDESYKKYIFNNIDTKIWFFILKNQGYFNPKDIPSPIQREKGYEMPLWLPLIYLEKISVKIKEGQYTELIEELINIIRHISENPKDNYRVWYFVIKILVNLPNDAITLDLLDLIPSWLDSNFLTDIQSGDICDKLLPKFLNDNSSEEDIKKAEKILYFIFNIEKINDNDIK